MAHLVQNTAPSSRNPRCSLELLQLRCSHIPRAPVKAPSGRWISSSPSCACSWSCLTPFCTHGTVCLHSILGDAEHHKCFAAFCDPLQNNSYIHHQQPLVINSMSYCSCSCNKIFNTWKQNWQGMYVHLLMSCELLNMNFKTTKLIHW